MIYFDNAATTPVLPEIADEIYKILVDDWGNPSSLHHKGFEAEKIINEAREDIAGILKVSPKTLYFVSCATEANNMAIRSALGNKRNSCDGVGEDLKHKNDIEKSKDNIVISPIEHSSIHALSRQLIDEGIEVRGAEVDNKGLVSITDIIEKVDENTKIVCVMHVNNEIGTIEPIMEIAEAVKKKNSNTKVLVDGVQGFGKIPIELKNSEIDYYTVSGHKIHAPKGIGMIYVKEGTNISPLLYGGVQEKGKRPGTENVAYIKALATALKMMAGNHEKILSLYDRAIERIGRIEGHLLISPENVYRYEKDTGTDKKIEPLASPYIINVGFSNVKAEVLLHFMEQKEMYVSTGSACAKNAPSHVLKAIKVPDKYLDGCIRISFQSQNSIDEIDPFFDVLEESINEIRSIVRASKAKR